MLSSHDSSASEDTDEADEGEAGLKADDTRWRVLPTNPQTSSTANITPQDFDDFEETLNDPEADLNELESLPSSERNEGGTPNHGSPSSSVAGTSSILPRSSDEDASERPSKRMKVDYRVDASQQSHGMFKFFKPISKEAWRVATDEEARQNKGKWADFEKQALFTKLAKQERAKEQARNRKRAQRAREKAVKLAAVAPPVS